MKISDLKIAVARKKLFGKTAAAGALSKTCKMGILLEVGDEKALKSFRLLREAIKLREDEVKIIICREKGSKNDLFEQTYISLKDFGWNGNTTDSSSDFIDTEYDVLISFTASENKMADFLVSVARARLKVGRKSEDNEGIFDLNISADLTEPEIFTEELEKYLKILKKTA